MFENKRTHEGEYYSRYIASWRNVGGNIYSPNFEEWLRTRKLTDVEIWEIKNMATCGKLELEKSAESFLIGKVCNM